MSDWYGFEPEGDEEAVTDQNGKPQPALIPKHQGIINTPTPPPPPVVEEIKELFINKYRHCGTEWEDVGTCSCCAPCFVCGEEVTPYESEELL